MNYSLSSSSLIQPSSRNQVPCGISLLFCVERQYARNPYSSGQQCDARQRGARFPPQLWTPESRDGNIIRPAFSVQLFMDDLRILMPVVKADPHLLFSPVSDSMLARSPASKGPTKLG